MEKYYTRACNFFYGSISKNLVKNKSTLPLCGDNKISFNKIELIINNSEVRTELKQEILNSGSNYSWKSIMKQHKLILNKLLDNA
mgnify:CR=1 FL=1